MKTFFHTKFFYTPINYDELDKDIEDSIELDTKYFNTPWTKNDWQKVLLQDSNHFLIFAKNKEKILSFALFSISPYENLAHLLKIIVLPNFRRMKIANRLLSAARQELFFGKYKIDKLYLEVSTLNESAISLYENFGFQKVNTVKHFYSNGENAHIMIFKS